MRSIFDSLEFPNISSNIRRIQFGDKLLAVGLFKKARAMGDYLIVGVIANDVAKEYKREPILTLEERVKVIEACKYVDQVIIAPPLRLTEEMIKELQITYLVRGDDFSQELLEDQCGVALKWGILRTVPYTKGISTTNIIHRIVDRYNQGEFKEGKEVS